MNIYQKIMSNYQNREDYKISTIKINDFIMDFIFIQGMTDLKFFISYLLPFISDDNYKILNNYIPSYCSKIDEYTLTNFDYLLSMGNLIIIISKINDDKKYYYHFPLNILPKRAPSESHLDPSNLFQSRDGLIEDAKDNLLLIKKRIKTDKLKIKRYNFGKNSLNDVYMLYHEDYKDKEYIKRIDETLNNNINTDITSINTLCGLFETSSLVPTTNCSGNTEYLVENILKGKVVLLSDCNCVGVILPTMFSNFTTTKDELDSPKFNSIYKRCLVLICMFFSIYFLGFFVAVCNYHSSILSLKIIGIIKITEVGTILPMFFEICLIMLCFELYNLSISRSPLGYVQNIVVLFGGVIVGQNIVNSGIVGPFVLLISSLCYIAGYSISNNPRFLTSISIFRFIILFFSFCFGLIGFFVSSILITYYLFKQKSVTEPYLSPFFPTNTKKIKSYFKPENN